MTTRGKALADATDAAFRRLNDELYGLDDDDLSLAPDGDWAIRDVLVHLAAWYQVPMEAAAGRDPVAALGVSPDLFSDPTEDLVNREINRQWRERPLGEVWDTLAARHVAYVSWLAALDEGSFDRPMHDLIPADSPLAGDTPLGTWSSWAGPDHYADHVALVRERADAAHAGATVAGELARIDAAAAEVNALLDARDADAEHRRDHGGWTLVDNLAHLAAWNRDAAALLRGAPRAVAVGVSDDVWAIGDEDVINAALLETTGGMSLDEARAAWAESVAELRRAVSELDDADLLRLHPRTDPIDPAGTELPAIRWIRSCSGPHLASHLPPMRALAGI